jgi:hypothetical protein
MRILALNIFKVIFIPGGEGCIDLQGGVLKCPKAI